MENSKTQSILRAVVLCTLYMAVGPSLVVLNKYILSSLHFSYPFLLSSLGLCFAAVAARVLSAAGTIEIGKQAIVTNQFWLAKVLPVGACHAATLAFGNAQYLYMGVALIQFLKAFTPIVVTAVASIMLRDHPSTGVVVSLAVLCLSTSFAASLDSSATPFGLMLAAGSASTEAVRLVLTQFVLQDCRFTLWESQYYLAPAGAVCLLLTSAFSEGHRLIQTGEYSMMLEHLPVFFLAASLGLGVQLLTAAVIQATSSVTLKVLSQVRNAGLVLTGVIIYGETVSTNQAIGYTASLIAFGFYNYFKLTESQSKPEVPPADYKKVEPAVIEDTNASGHAKGTVIAL